ncbi:MAG: VOC family protein [Haloarculaceae archaeon]
MTTDASGSLSAARVGRVALRVASLDGVLPFYRDVVGAAVEREGDRALLRAGDGPLVVLEAEPSAPARPADAAGLFHLAIRVPDRGSLGDVLERVRERGSLSGASDHLVSEALYLRDPEGNGVEVYCDRPRSEWPRTDGGVSMDTLPLALDDLAAAARGETGLPGGTDVGHVHLEVTDLDRSTAFYADALGLGVQDDGYEGARFLAAGDYHHHVGLNVWNGRRAPAGASRGLAWFELLVPDRETLAAVRDRLVDRGHAVAGTDEGFAVDDPDGIEVRVAVAA